MRGVNVMINQFQCAYVYDCKRQLKLFISEDHREHRTCTTHIHASSRSGGGGSFMDSANSNLTHGTKFGSRALVFINTKNKTTSKMKNINTLFGTNADI